MKVSLFKNIKDPSVGIDREIMTVLNGIRDGRWEEPVNDYRDAVEEYAKGSPEAERFKMSLPIFTGSGTFEYRAADNLKEHSGLIIIDIDDLSKDEISKYKNLLKDDPYIFACFVSVSGYGLAVVVKIDPSKHLDSFFALQDYFLSKYSIEIDKSCKDVSRARFVSFDPDMLLNVSSKFFTTADTYKRPKDSEIGEKIKDFGEIKNDSDVIAIAVSLTESSYKFKQGERNLFCFVLGCNSNRLCISKDVVKAFLKDNISFNDDFSLEEAFKAVENGFKASEDDKKINPLEVLQKTYPFIETFTKGDKEIEYINKTLFVDWLSSELGFGIWYEGENPSYVRVENNIVSVWDRIRIKNFVSELLKESPKIREMLIRNNKLTAEENFHYLRNLSDKITVNRDPKDASYFYFKNCFYRVESGKVCPPKTYDELDWLIWDSDIVDHDVAIRSDYKEGDFYKFLFNICRRDEGRMVAFLSVLGYLLHTHKDESNAKAIVLVDEGSNSEEANGGTGKSLTYKALGHVRNLTEEDGKNFNFTNNRFLFQKVSHKSMVFVIDDPGKFFPFDKLFSVITQGMNIERKREQAFTLPFRLSPKVLITTNYMIQSNDESHRRRFVEVELYPHYNSDFTPVDEFKRRFFSNDWDKAEWDRFYTLMMEATSIFLKNGIIKYQSENLAEAKIIAQTCREFFEYAENAFSNTDGEWDKKEKWADFKMIYPDFEKGLTLHKFTKWLKSYAKFKGFVYEEKPTAGNKSKLFWFLPW